MANQLKNLGLTERGGKAVVSSRDIARVFGKEHKNVLKDIRELKVSEAFGRLNFEQSSYTNEQNKRQPEYLLTRDGFTILAMGYTGDTAMKFKEAYISAFNEMERRLQSPMLPGTYKEALIALVAKVEENERLESQNRALIEDNDTLEIALNESLKFYTVAKYNGAFNKGWNMAKCQEVGKQLSAYCRARAIEIRKCQTNDERFGCVNSYPLTAWEGFLEGATTTDE